MSLGITTAKDYRKKTEVELADLAKAIDNSRTAINAVTTVYHLHEWLWGKQIKPLNPRQVENPDTSIVTIVKNKKEFVRWLEKNCPHFELIRDLANGLKHAHPAHFGGQVGGWGVGPYGVGPYGSSYLLIDLGAAHEDRYLVASDVIAEAGRFMVNLAKKLGA